MPKVEAVHVLERRLATLGAGVASLRSQVASSGTRVGDDEPAPGGGTPPPGGGGVGGAQPVSPIPGVPSALLRHPGQSGGVGLQPLVERSIQRYGRAILQRPGVKR